MKYDVVFVRQEHPGNTNMGLDISFPAPIDVPEDVNALEQVADEVSWGSDQLVAVGVRGADDEWIFMDATRYLEVLGRRTQDKRDEVVESVIERAKEEKPRTDWGYGDKVLLTLGDDVYAIGYIKIIDGRKATVVEAHAFHSMWGGSSVGRGTQHHILLEDLKPCPSRYNHIVKMVFEQREHVGEAS